MRGKKQGHRGLRWLGMLILAGVLCYAGLVGFVVIREHQVNRPMEEMKDDYDAIVVLGAQVLPSGEPNTQLQWRLDTALRIWEKKQVPIVVCGAQGKDEPLTEAEAMKTYLTAHGVPAEMILTDPDSFNTRENIRNAARLLRERGDVNKVMIVTSDYHLPRAMAIARDAGLETAGMGSPCKPEYCIKNHAREALSWVKYWLQKVFG
ncbi:MAG: YdcF family protein [Clostridia bacterium]|nr:YdcF family protein [Clostridia bacterium]